MGRVFILLIVVFVALPSGAAEPSFGALERELENKPDDVKIRLKLAKHHIGDNKFDKVIELLNAYTDQLTPEGMRLLAFSYSGKKDYANEVRVLNLLVAKDDQDYRSQMLLGQAYIKQASVITDIERNRDTLTLGIQRLRKTLQISPKFKPAFDLLLNIFIQQRSHNEARELITEGITKFGKRADLFRELCRLDTTDGYLVQAVQNCQESISISREFPDHYVYLLQAYHDQKEEGKAEKTAVAAAKKFPNSEFVQWAAGTLFLRKKNYPVAARYFKAAVRAQASGRALFGLAQAQFELGEEEAALDPFSKACKADPAIIDTFLAASGRLKQAGKTALGLKYQQAANICKP